MFSLDEEHVSDPQGRKKNLWYKPKVDEARPAVCYKNELPPTLRDFLLLRRSILDKGKWRLASTTCRLAGNVKRCNGLLGEIVRAAAEENVDSL